MAAPRGDSPAASEPAIPRAGRTLLLGLGSPIRGDDGLGPRLARDLASAASAGAPIDAVPEAPPPGLDFATLLQGYRRAVIIDTVRVHDPRPGRWHHLTLADLAATRHFRGPHDANLATSVELGRRLGYDLPPDEAIHLFVVEAVEVDVFRETLSEPMREAYPKLLEDIRVEIGPLIEPDRSVAIPQAPPL